MNVQYCDGDRDISESPTARDDADVVRVWDHETLIVAMEQGSGDEWVISASDVEDVAGSRIPAGRRGALRIVDKIVKGVRA